MSKKTAPKEPPKIEVKDGDTIVFIKAINSPVYGRKPQGFDMTVGTQIRVVDAQAFVDRKQADLKPAATATGGV